jgi:uncharacterized protein YbjT (DUF2867 family)
MTEKILVAGGAGRTGQIIVSKLIANSFHPHVLVRDLPKAEALFGEEVILHVGDVRDPDMLIQPLHGVEALISAVGTCTPVGENCPKRVDYEGVVNLVKAAQWSGVKRFILISSIAVTHPEHPLNRFGKILDWKRLSEDALRQSGLDYTIIRPGGLIDKPGNGRGLIFSQGDQILGTISREDLAEICLQALQHANLSRVTFEAVDADKKSRSNWAGLFASLTPDLIE